MDSGNGAEVPTSTFDGVTVELNDHHDGSFIAGGEKSAPVPGDESKKSKGCLPSCWTITIWTLPFLLAALIGAGIALGIVAGANGGSLSFGGGDRGASGDAFRASAASHEDFEWERSQYFPHFNFTANIFKHKETGAEVLSIRTSDINKAAALVIRTPAEDSTGVPHIMMHSMLMGSESYPTTNPGPFFRLASTSLNTYINGLLLPDTTLLPVASANLADFRNLVKVYMDGAFHPLVLDEPMLMKSEGWHLSLKDASKPEDVTLEGVVVNKVRNAFASPSARLSLLMQESLFPDNTYKHMYLGTLQDIPNLTTEGFKSYYQRHYNPSNTRFFFYGDDDEHERLQLLTEALEGFSQQDTSATAVTPQAPFSSPRNIEGSFPGASADGSFVVSAWMLGRGTEGVPVRDQVPLQVLHNLLTGSKTSPLLAALYETEAGVPLSTLDEDYMQWMYYVGFRGVNASNATALGLAQGTALEKLQELAEAGFSREDVDAALFTVEMGRKQTMATDKDTGVNLLRFLANTWVYERDVFDVLEWDKQFDELRKRLGSGERVLEELVRTYLLENTHRIDVVFSPDEGLAAMEEKEMEKTLHGLMKHRDPHDVVAETRTIQEFEQLEDTPEDIAKIPTLELSDIDDPVEEIPQEVVLMEGTGLPQAPALLLHRQPTAGILFATLGLNITGDVTESTLKLLPLLVTAMRHADPGRDQLVRSMTGGLSVGINVDSPQHGDNQDVPYIFLEVGSSSRESSGPDMMELLYDVLVNMDLSSNEAEKIMRREVRVAASNSKTALKEHPYWAVSNRAKAQLKPAGWIEDQLSGIAYLEHVQAWNKKLEAEAEGGDPGAWDDLRLQLEDLKSRILGEPRAVLSLTGDEQMLQRASGSAQEVLGAVVTVGLKHKGGTATAAPWSVVLPRQHEAVVTHNGGNMLIWGADISNEYSYNGAAMAAEGILTDHLITKVRKEGGAYDSWMLLLDDGYLTFKSYVDPQLHQTLDAFQDAPGHLRNFTESLRSKDRKERQGAERELTGAIIGAVRDNFPYLSPTEKAKLAYHRFLRKTSMEELQTWKTSLLRTSAKDLDRIADAIEGGDFTLVASISNSTKASLQDDIKDGQLQFDSFVMDLLE